MEDDRDLDSIESKESTGLVRSKGDMVSRGLRYIEEAAKLADGKTIQVGNLSDLHLIRRMGEGAVLAHAVSPDGSLIAVWSVEGAYVHQYPEGREIGHLQLEEQRKDISPELEQEMQQSLGIPVNIGRKAKCMDISPDNRLVALGLEDGGIILWRYKEGNETHEITSDYKGVEKLKFCPNGKSLVAIYSREQGLEYPISLLDVATQTSIQLGTCKDMPYEILISPNDQYCLVHPGMGIPELWDLHRGRFVRSVTEHDAFDDMPVFSRDSRFLGTEGAPVGRVSDIDTGRVVEQWDLCDDERGPAWIRAEYDQRSKPWEREEAAKTLDPYTGKIRCLAFTPDSKFIASGGEEDKVRIWDIETGHLTRTFLLDRGDNSGQFYRSTAVNSLSYSPDGALLAAGKSGGVLLIIDMNSGDVLQELEGHRGGEEFVSLDRGPCVKFSPDGNLLGTGGTDGKLIVWNPQDWSILWSREADTGGIQKGALSIAFSRDSMMIASGGMDGNVKLWDAKRGDLIKDLRQPENGQIYSISFAQDDKLIAARGATFLALYDLETGIRDVINSRSRVGLLVSFPTFILSNTISGLSPDKRAWAVGCATGGIQLWDLVDKKLAHRLFGHQGSVDCTVFSPDGRYLASGGRDGVIYLWGI